MMFIIIIKKIKIFYIDLYMERMKVICLEVILVVGAYAYNHEKNFALLNINVCD